MPRAGFYAIDNSEIRFGRDGVWYADGEPIANRRIADLFSRHVRRRADGGYMLLIGEESAPIAVDDTPYVVIGAELGVDGALRIDLNDGTRELLVPETLRCGAGEVLYCEVKAGSERARFLRPAYYQLARYVSETEGGGAVLRLPSGDYSIAR